MLSAQIDQHAHRSDPYHYEMEAYFEVVKMGEAALAELLAAGAEMSTWRMQAIIDIASSLERPIDLPLAGATYGEYLTAVLSWGEQNGYVPGLPPAA